MVGFKSYERYLNKKQKQEAFINLVTNDKTDTQDIIQESFQHKGISQSFVGAGHSREEKYPEGYKDVRKTYLELKKAKMAYPKLYLNLAGEKALIRQSNKDVIPLPYMYVKILLLHALTGSLHQREMNRLQWCTLLRKERLEHVVLIFVEGIGSSELAAVYDWTQKSAVTRNSSKFREVKDIESSQISTSDSNKHQRSIDDTNNRPKTPKRKTGEAFEDLDDENYNSNKSRKHKKMKLNKENEAGDSITTETSIDADHPITLYNVMENTLGLSFSAVPVCLDIDSPSQNSENPIDELLCFDITRKQESTIIQKHENMETAYNSGALMQKPKSTQKRRFETIQPVSTNELNGQESKTTGKVGSKSMMTCEADLDTMDHNSCKSTRPSNVDQGKTPDCSKASSSQDVQDKMDRTELLLSVQEMVKLAYPMPFLPPACEDEKFQHLHTDWQPVTSMSPLFAIDCEMCMSDVGKELTRISVVNENLEVLYASYVKPERKILNYMTAYSGVAPRHLLGVTTSLEDVQRTLRRVIPKDAILVGHSLNSDLHAMKIFHPYVIDTAFIYNLRYDRYTFPSLKLLMKLFLKKEIQSIQIQGHDPSEDARASLQLVLLKLQHDATYGDTVKGGVLPFNLQEQASCEMSVKMEKSILHRRFHSMSFHSQDDVSSASVQNIFMQLKEQQITSTIITSNLSIFKPYLASDPLNINTIRCKSIKESFRATEEEILLKKFVICHCKISDDYLSESKVKSKRELEEFDESYKKLRESVPEKTMLVTIFAGSPESVPLDKRSNGILWIDLKGQQPKDYFHKYI